MKLTDLLKARRQAGEMPTLKKAELTSEQQQWFSSGLCIECGKAEQQTNSLICAVCQDKLSINDIRNEIDTLRKQILGS